MKMRSLDLDTINDFFGGGSHVRDTIWHYCLFKFNSSVLSAILWLGINQEQFIQFADPLTPAETATFPPLPPPGTNRLTVAPSQVNGPPT